MMCAQLSCQRFLIIPTIHRNRLEAHLPRVLNSEMTEPADAVNCDDVSRARAGITERVVDRDARAHEWTSVLGGYVIGNQSERGHWCNHVLGIPAIEVDACHFSIDAHRKVTTPALFADKTMSAMPAHANALTFTPRGDVVANGIDESGHLVTRNTRILKRGPETFFNESVAVAN